MFRLVYYELQKIWCKKSFIFAVILLFVLNLFFLWYTNISDDTPKLSAYKLFQSKIAYMSEDDKKVYINKLKQDIDSVAFVMEIDSMQNSEIGSMFAEEKLNENKSLYEKYYDLYNSGEYLNFTSSFLEEKNFIDEIYNEYKITSNYENYLKSVKENKNTLENISIFNNQNTDNYSMRNIEKSSKDYEKLNSDDICFMPSKTVKSTVESVWTDVFLILLSFLFVSYLITEEKEKNLFCITRSTKYGVKHNIIAKIIALFIHCITFGILFYVSNYLFFGLSCGFTNMMIKLQSLAPYIESNLDLDVLEYVVIVVISKSIVIFCLSNLLVAICIISNSIAVPYIFGVSSLAISFILYFLIPAVSKFNVLKFLNLYGILKTENVFGTYLNFNLFEFPISYILLFLIVVISILLIGFTINIYLFSKGNSLQIKRKNRQNKKTKYHYHSTLIYHEMYKILITNYGLLILVFFSILIGYNELNHNYIPSVYENYYQSIMLKLEGKQTNEKIEIINTERKRFDNAKQEIEKINEAINKGEISSSTGSEMKTKWNSVLAFYPEFEKVEEQYKFVCESNGVYLYDTGYLYLFGFMGDGLLNDFLLLTLGIVFTFSSVISFEYQNNAWMLINVSKKGKSGVIKAKIIVCIILTALFSIIPFTFRYISINKAFSMHGLLYGIQNILVYRNMPIWMNILTFILIKIITQIIILIITTMIVIGISRWRKNNAQAIFFSILILCVPIILMILGFNFMKYLSLYGAYSYLY